jgi:multiple sugar transport system ATP-binding protein
VEARLSGANGAAGVEFGSFRLGIPPEVFDRRPALRAFEGRSVILGLRPEDIEDAALVADAPSERRMRARVLLSEALGADVVVHLRIDAPAVLTDDVKELADDVGVEVLQAVQERAEAGENTFLARLNPRTEAQPEREVDLAVDVTRLHFFDPETGLAIYDGEDAPGPAPAVSPPVASTDQ